MVCQTQRGLSPGTLPFFRMLASSSQGPITKEDVSVPLRQRVIWDGFRDLTSTFGNRQ